MTIAELNANADQRKYNRLKREAQTKLETALVAAKKEFDETTKEAQADYEREIAPHAKRLSEVVKPAETKLKTAAAEARKVFDAEIVKARSDAGFDF